MISTPCPASCISSGCSTWHPAHQLAKKFTSTGRPRRSASLNFAGCPLRPGRLKAGAGLPINGEGISRGSRSRPTARNTSSPPSNRIGNRNHSFIWAVSFRSGGEGIGRELHRSCEPVAAIGRGEQPSKKHEHAAEPYEPHHRLVVQPKRPVTVGKRFSERHIQIAPQVVIDGGFGHHAALRVIQPFLRVELCNCLFVALNDDGAAI